MTTRRILLTEDDSNLRTSLAFVLKSGGYEVLEAADGLEALDALQREQNQGRLVDLLITDIRMPNMDGMALLSALKQSGQQLPSMVISGHGDKEVLIDLLRMGCSDYLAKPFEPDEVLSKVSTVLDKVARQQDQKKQVNSKLRDATAQLSREASTARRDMEHLKHEVKTAVEAYHELMDCCTLDHGMDVELRNRTYKELGGDYAGTCCQDGRCDLLVADVAGHDLAASYQTILIKSFFDENCRTGDDGVTFFRKLNTALRESGSNERMVTAIFVRLDMHAGKGQAVCAGHPSLIRYDLNEMKANWLQGEGDVLGLHREVDFEVVNFDISPGERYFLYTDGLTGASRIDGASGRRRILSAEGLGELVEVFGYQPLGKHMDAIWNYALHFCRGKQADDMLLLGVEVPKDDKA